MLTTGAGPMTEILMDSQALSLSCFSNPDIWVSDVLSHITMSFYGARLFSHNPFRPHNLTRGVENLKGLKDLQLEGTLIHGKM